MISLQNIRSSYFWVFFMFYMYEMFGVLYWKHSFTEAVNNLIVEFGPAFFIYLFILFYFYFKPGSNEEINND